MPGYLPAVLAGTDIKSTLENNDAIIICILFFLYPQIRRSIFLNVLLKR
jgi:hypothetical protein